MELARSVHLIEYWWGGGGSKLQTQLHQIMWKMQRYSRIFYNLSAVYPVMGISYFYNKETLVDITLLLAHDLS